MAARGRIDRRFPRLRRRQGLALVEDLEPGYLLELAVVVDLEIFRLEAFDGMPVFVQDVDRNLDDDDARFLAHRLRFGLLRLLGLHRGRGGEKDQESRSDTDPEREGHNHPQGIGD